jgi:hypothetical protein
MPARYHPLYDGVWSDDALEGARFEVKAFFVFLCANPLQRPSGIYRATDQQLAALTELPLKRVRSYLAELVKRGRILRDGAWIFVRGYLARQPHHENLLNAVRQNVEECGSPIITEAFYERYPLIRQRSRDRRQTVGQRSADRSPTYERKPSTEQLRQSSTSYRAELPTEQPSGDGRPKVDFVNTESTSTPTPQGDWGRERQRALTELHERGLSRHAAEILERALWPGRLKHYEQTGSWPALPNPDRAESPKA